jgi:hypothetical protein
MLVYCESSQHTATDRRSLLEKKSASRLEGLWNWGNVCGNTEFVYIKRLIIKLTEADVETRGLVYETWNENSRYCRIWLEISSLLPSARGNHSPGKLPERSTCMLKQERQFTYEVTKSRVRVTIIAVENNNYYIFWVCVCSFIYPACNAHASYFHLWLARLYRISVRDRQIDKQTCLILRRTVRDIITNVKCPLFFSDFIETGTFSTGCRKIMKYQM